jgi:MFS family permease
MASTILVGRVTVGRFLDRVGHRQALLPCLGATALGMSLVAISQGKVMFLAAALVFGAGFGLVYPAYTAYIMKRIPPWRRGAAFGAMLAAFDTGVGSGSTVMGGLIHQLGFRPAFGIAAALAALSLPHFLSRRNESGSIGERRGHADQRSTPAFRPTSSALWKCDARPNRRCCG